MSKPADATPPDEIYVDFDSAEWWRKNTRANEVRYLRAQGEDVGDAPDEAYHCTLCPPGHQWSVKPHRHSAPRTGGGGLQDEHIRFVRADQTEALLDLLERVWTAPDSSPSVHVWNEVEAMLRVAGRIE